MAPLEVKENTGVSAKERKALITCRGNKKLTVNDRIWLCKSHIPLKAQGELVASSRALQRLSQPLLPNLVCIVVPHTF